MTAPDTETTSGGFRGEVANVGVPALGGGFMVVCQVALGVVILLLWQGASGRLVAAPSTGGAARRSHAPPAARGTPSDSRMLAAFPGMNGCRYSSPAFDSMR